ncbi:DUF447 domain-containing protein [Pyrococcus abyssi]|uniref:DUF447 family protein n=1 Tax=Pyrococcus abyssi (strain GE5 / Orsay) TaxID=272844 RepID=Q9V0G9_PYRAB|nr:DUF447 domain-containing protein [Pyrococcus abyssi]CAB49734.1 Hypothetical protein PAB1814 [Pyrococcus abyssi GE5]CCE70221.1 TPA: hypothetical protein PAB1814 [Pyrococcus abyssi GE5]
MSLETLFPEEGKVYECLLITRSNVTPIGIVRIGDSLKFKIFEGKSFLDLEESSYAIVQVVDDVELLASLAFNFFPELELEDAVRVPLKKVKGYPWVEGVTNCKEILVKDELGESRAKACSLKPVYVGIVKRILKPISRADNYLLELAVLGTRILVARNRGINVRELEEEAEKVYMMYKKLGGNSKIGEKIYELIKRV